MVFLVVDEEKNIILFHFTYFEKFLITLINIIGIIFVKNEN